MKVVLTDGTELSCRNFKAIDSGVLLTKDKKRKKVVGFVPTHQLRYVVQDGVEPVAPAAETETDVVDSDTSSTAAGELSIAAPAEPTEPATPDAAAERGESTDDSEPESELRRLGGLGATYAERLQSAGYGTLTDLAGADPVAVAEAAAVAPGRGRRWVNAAIRATEADEQGPTDAEEGDVDAEATDVDAEAADGEGVNDEDANGHDPAEATEDGA